MSFYSPLRYPGGKGKLAAFMKYMITRSGHSNGTYIEAFAGGAGIAMELLLNNDVNNIVINDYDKGIWSFWKAVLSETEKFIEQIETVPLTIEEWEKQHEIVTNHGRRYSFELGFATFYLNRVNRSGIIKGGVIGGKDQSGDWTMGVRFNRGELAKRIMRIAARKKDIKLYNKDINSFIKHYVPLYDKNALIYLDPPYFKKGKQLYMNYFRFEDHVRIEKTIREDVNCDWIITYDDAPEIERIYKDYRCYLYDLNYSASSKCLTSELMIFRRGINIPNNSDLLSEGININLRAL